MFEFVISISKAPFSELVLGNTFSSMKSGRYGKVTTVFTQWMFNRISTTLLFGIIIFLVIRLNKETQKNSLPSISNHLSKTNSDSGVFLKVPEELLIRTDDEENYSYILISRYVSRSFIFCVPSESRLKKAYYFGGNVQSYIHNHHSWEPFISTLFSAITISSCSEQNKVIDVGANTGFFSALSLANGCEVDYVEANAEHLLYMQKTAKLMNASNIHYYQNLVSEKKETKAYNGWSIDESGDQRIGTLQLETLISKNILLLKLDIEGFELGALKSIKRFEQIKFIILEYTYFIRGMKLEPLKILEILLPMFDCFLINEEQHKLIELPSEYREWTNGAAQDCNKSETQSCGVNLIFINKNRSDMREISSFLG